MQSLSPSTTKREREVSSFFFGEMGRGEKDGVETESSAVFSSQTSNQVRPSAESEEVGGGILFLGRVPKGKGEEESSPLLFGVLDSKLQYSTGRKS